MIRALVSLTLAVGVLGPAAPLARGQKDGELNLPKLLAAKPLEEAGGDDELRRLLKARYNAALEEARARYQEYVAGKVTVDQLTDSFRRLTAAGLEVYEGLGDRLGLRQQFLEVARTVEKVTKERFDAGQLPRSALAQARYLRLDAEIQLLRARQDARLGGKK